MIRRPPRSTLFPSRRSSDLGQVLEGAGAAALAALETLSDRLEDKVVVALLSGGNAESEQRSEEHTSELQSLAYLVCRLLLEKKNKRTRTRYTPHGTKADQLV